MRHIFGYTAIKLEINSKWLTKNIIRNFKITLKKKKLTTDVGN